ncbi:OadG family transporter subunit [Entomospira culicis]|uniref:Oxaloacetate decarboxylase gamma chain n=1 Tax=Entomospira culicis TaxID=2719989 RepID=A0A968KWM7_9SPIO|nr:OadG family transporter subunit [Entomospira culicis]NIZ19198.1 hypothetical protein [Entomospira culicis]NIZ69412.1 hypothetical protein [Entomospira culicis]WDI36529.1 OadG family transporter subunit [Entomospira culicis]WDI38155.1 OadG family transporter subunit [Entomospira culicis]
MSGYFQQLTNGAIVTIIGFSTVFLFLFLLILVMHIMRNILSSQEVISGTQESPPNQSEKEKHALAIHIALHHRQSK